MSWLNGQVTKRHHAGFDAVRGKQKRDIPLSRFLGGLVSLSIGASLIYASAHYIGAFVHVGKIVGLNASTVDLDSNNSNAQMVMTPIRARSKYKRVYLRKNQAIEAEYVIPKGARLDLHILQCQQRPLVEVFKCAPIGEKSVTVTNKTQGSNKIFVSQAGFYYFSQTVTLPGNIDGKREKDYALLWRRA